MTDFGMTQDRSDNTWLATPSGVARVAILAWTESKNLDSGVRALSFKRIPLETPRGSAYDVVERILGHLSVSTAMIYTHSDTEHLRQSVESLAELFPTNWLN
jgi:hypothetical protein